MSDTNYHKLSENRTSSLLGHNYEPPSSFQYEEDHLAPLETARSHLRVQNLDAFLVKVYNYYQGKGFLSIVLNKFLSLLSLAWVICFSTFLFTSVNYTVLLETYSLDQSIGYTGMPVLLVVCLVMFCSFWLWEFVKFLREVSDNWEIKQFYDKDLNISTTELQTAEWREVVQKIIKVPGLCIAKQDEPLTPLDIANRIMRKDNYMIAMINKDLLALNPPWSSTNIITRTVEWSLAYTILNYVFDGRFIDGINPTFLDHSNSAQLAQTLRKRFRLLGIVTLCLFPFVFFFLIIYSFFQYGEEIRNRPTAFATRHWTPLARWKFRELNELPHVFQRRLNRSYEAADRYVNCFPSYLLIIFARFGSFIVSSFLGVLLIIGFFDDQALFKIEILENKTAFWFLGIGGAVVAVLRGLIPNENAVVEPQMAMEEVVQHTHYFPKAWRGRLHSHRVLNDFTALFQFKIVIYALELWSVIFVPFVLLFSLPKCSERIIEFFREHTIHEKGVGYICKFASFPLEDISTSGYGLEANKGRRKMKQGKVEKSFLNFKFNHPEWKPSQQGEKYLESLSEALGSSQQLGRSTSATMYRGGYHSDESYMVNNNNSNGGSFNNLAGSRWRDSPNVQDSSLDDIHKYFYRSVLHPPSDSKML